MSRKQLAHDLSSIRRGSEHDLADATALAARMLAKAKASMDNATFELSKDLFVAVALYTAYEKEDATFKDMLDYLVDSSWDSAMQMFLYFRHCDKSFQQKGAALWLKGFMKKIERLTEGRAAYLAKRCHVQWKTAFDQTEKTAKRKAKPRSSLQVFNSESIANALEKMCDLKDEKKTGGDRILANAQSNDGYRCVPNVKKAGVRLEAAKNRFENLVEPIARLQTELVLAGAMKPEKFRITPILLLGDPGIGKTFLATELCKALDVPMEKLSAGGAQGGFQLTGSHPSWQSAKSGSLFALLAKSKSAAPVVVIDEVDKIRDSTHPVLPVLLDLLEPNTAKCFKDEFFEMEFDASRIIFVLTANSLDGVPTPLLSRVEVFDVPRPEATQRLRIIQDMAEQLRKETKKQIELDKGTSEILAERIDLDLRKTIRLVNEAFSRAMQSGVAVAELLVPKSDGPEGRLASGFGRTDKTAWPAL